LWTFIATIAAAQDSAAQLPRPIAGHPVLEMRTGIDEHFDGHPVVCAELIPLAWLSVEGCGTGSGFLHHGAGVDFAHFRARASPIAWTRGRSELRLLGGLGFAEIQRSADRPGFRFGKPSEADPVEAAGPEASAALHGRAWIDQGGRVFASADLNAGAAWIEGAPAVLGSGGVVVPFTALTVGLGF
jgi:hypothetical protein